MKNHILPLVAAFTFALSSISVHAADNTSEKFKWAFVDKQKIEMAIMSWKHEQVEAMRKNENLSPEQMEKVHIFENLQREYFEKQIESHNTRRLLSPPLRPDRVPPTLSIPPRPGAAPDSPNAKELQALGEKLAAAKVPIADIIDHRTSEEARLHKRFTTDKLVAEYAKGRYELVIDKGYSFNQSVIYQASGSSVDITEAILQLFQEQTKS